MLRVKVQLWVTRLPISTTQTKRATEAKSRQNAKKDKTYHAADRGDYNVNFPVPSTDGAQDVPQFLKQLGALLVFLTTRLNVTTELTSNLKR